MEDISDAIHHETTAEQEKSENDHHFQIVL